MTATDRELTEQVIQDKHGSYDDFNQKQLIIQLAPGEKVVIKTYDTAGEEVVAYSREFVALYENSHVNIVFQTKGVKKLESTL
jgi:hypothetical protein